MRKVLLVYLVIFAISAYIGTNWDNLSFIKENVHGVLDPTFGKLIQWNTWIGFAIVVMFITFVLTLAQRFFVNQKEMKAIKEEQKFVQNEMKKYKDNPEKLMELQKRQFETISKSFHLMSGSLIVTALPIILFFRWFQETLRPLIGGWWILYYLVGAIAFSSLFRKLLKMA